MLDRALELVSVHWQLTVVFTLWQTPVIVPLKILVVFLHELFLAIAIWATGGEVLELSISARQGGHVIGHGGNSFIILSAEYLGALALDLPLLIAALSSTADPAMVVLFGAFMLFVTVFPVRDLFAAPFSGGTGFAILATARFASQRVSSVVLQIIGLRSMLCLAGRSPACPDGFFAGVGGASRAARALRMAHAELKRAATRKCCGPSHVNLDDRSSCCSFPAPRAAAQARYRATPGCPAQRADLGSKQFSAWHQDRTPR